MQITSMMPTCLTMQTPITRTRGSTVAQGETGGSGRNICKNSNMKCFQFKIETKTLKFNWKILGRRPLWGRSSWTSFGTVQRGWEPRMSAEYTLNSWCGSSRTRPTVNEVYFYFYNNFEKVWICIRKAITWVPGCRVALGSPGKPLLPTFRNLTKHLFPTHFLL